MATEKVSVTLDVNLVEQARAAAGEGGLSAFLNTALARELQRARLTELLHEFEAEHGPITAEDRKQLDDQWPGVAAP
jgi:hypothetical protein